MPGLLRGMARTAAVAGTAQATRGRVARRQQSRWAEEDQSQYQQAPPAPAPAPAPASDPIDQLERLATMKAQGILTDEEFQTQKQRILGA